MGHHSRKIQALAWLLTGLLFAGCQSLSQPPQTPQAALADAEALMQKQDYGQALATLEHFGSDALSPEDKASWFLLAARATHALGDSWDAFFLYRDFIREQRFLQKIPALGDLTYEIGESLAMSDGAFWPFYSDRNRAKAVLSEFVSLFSTRPQMPDALHRLAEMAWEDENYELARERFTQIITGNYPRSVWNTKAAFRVAMCYFRQLEGPEYDLEGMQRALAELRDFLGPDTDDVENPNFRREAEVALRTVRSWLAEKHESLAAFYFTLHNQQGGQHHLRIAATDFPDTTAGQRAGRRLTNLGRMAPSEGGQTR